MKLTLLTLQAHERGKIYKVAINGRTVSILLTFHALERIAKWQLTEQAVLRSLLYPEEVLRGHRDRFIAHRRSGRHIVRAVYEYEDDLPVVVTVYHPLARRYFQGEGIYENHILS
jgi:hypothetical protein